MCLQCRRPSSIPGSGKSAREGIGYPLQYPWASLVAHLVKHPPAMQEIWVRSLGWEDPLEKGKAIHSSFLAWRIPWTSPWGPKELDTTEQLSVWYSQLTNNVVTVSGEQKRKRPDHMYTYIHSPPNTPPIQAHATLSRAS